jgi:TPR repeat protein
MHITTWGYSVRKGYAEAVKWFLMAAKQCLAKAQHNLGLSYENGEGVNWDYAKAVKWYRKAAEQDYALAQVLLGLTYFSGEGHYAIKE